MSSESDVAVAAFSRLPHHLIDRGMLNNLRPAALRVLLLMLRLADRAGRCWPSQRTMASRTGSSVRGVQLAVSELVAAGLLQRERRSCNGQATLYRLNLSSSSAAAAAARSADERPAEAHDASPCTRTDRRTDVREKAQGRAQTPRNTLRNTKKQDQDTTPSSACAAGDVCVEGEAGARANQPRADSSDDPDSSRAQRCIDRLQALGISEQSAMRLLLSHAPPAIECAAANAEFLATRQRLANPAGYVIDALRANYGPLPERLDVEKREARRRNRHNREQRDADAARTRAAREAEQAERSASEALRMMREMNDAARAEAVREALAGQPSSVRSALEHRDPRVSRNLAMLVRAYLDAQAAGSRDRLAG